MTPGYKYVTSHRALEAAFEPLFAAGHLVHPRGLAPADAAKESARLIAIHLGAHKESVPVRVNNVPVAEEPSDDFFN